MSQKNKLPLQLRLYVAGDAPNSLAAVSNLRTVVSALPDSEVDIEIVDVVQTPERGLRDGVFVTPMLVKLAPHPERRVLGNLHNRQQLLSALGIDGLSS